MIKLTRAVKNNTISISGITARIASSFVTDAEKGRSVDGHKFMSIITERDCLTNLAAYNPTMLNNLNRLQRSKNFIHPKQSYFFSSVKQPPQERQPGTESIEQPSFDDQDPIQVSPSKQTLLFMDSNKLSSIIRLNHVMRQMNREPHSTLNLIFAVKNNQTQLSSFTLLDKKIHSLTKYNQYLANGKFQQYGDYPIVKLLQICLKFISLYPKAVLSFFFTPQKSLLEHWKSLEHFIRKRMHNCSTRDYMKLVYIVLNAYHFSYKFNNQFIESLISGLKKEVPLMEEQELMQLFLVISQPFMKQRTEWESSLRFSQTNNISPGEKIKSPFFQHQILFKMHDQILEKIVKRYQNKFMNTQLFIKEEELFKLCWWLKVTICFKNQSFGHIKNNQYSNLAKNKFIVGMVNVLSSKLHPLLKKNTISQKVNGQVRQIQSKTTSFKSVTQLIHFMECLSLARDYLSEEAKMGRICEGIDEKSKEVRLRADTWGEKSVQVNDILRAVLDYQGVKDLIQKTITNLQSEQKNQSEEKNQSQTKNQSQKNEQPKENLKESLHMIEKKWKLIRLMNEAEKFGYKQSCDNDKKSAFINWQFQLINEFKILSLLDQTHHNISSQLHKPTGYIKTISDDDVLRLRRLGEYQINLLYQLFDNMFVIKQHNQPSVQEMNEAEKALENIDFGSIFQQIFYTCFYHCHKPGGIFGARYGVDGNSDCIHPRTLLNIINFDIALIKLNPNSEPNYQMFASIQLILSYTNEMLGRGAETDKYLNISNYIREVQFALYNYLTLYIASPKGDSQSSLDVEERNNYKMYVSKMLTQAKQYSQTILTRNTRAQQYLQENNPEYQEMVSNEKRNPFVTHNKFLAFSTNNYRALATNQLSKSPKRMLLEGENSSGYDQKAILLGEYIMKCINNEKKSLLQNDDIIKLNKFFTQIKAFSQIKFYSPITPFFICPQFIVTLPHPINNTQPQKTDQPIKRQLIKALMFLEKEQLMRVELISIKEMYLMHGVQTIAVDIKEFLNLHINERIQLLNRLVFGSLNQQNSQQQTKHTIHQITS